MSLKKRHHYFLCVLFCICSATSRTQHFTLWNTPTDRIVCNALIFVATKNYGKYCQFPLSGSSFKLALILLLPRDASITPGPTHASATSLCETFCCHFNNIINLIHSAFTTHILDIVHADSASIFSSRIV